MLASPEDIAAPIYISTLPDMLELFDPLMDGPTHLFGEDGKLLYISKLRQNHSSACDKPTNAPASVAPASAPASAPPSPMPAVVDIACRIGQLFLHLATSTTDLASRQLLRVRAIELIALYFAESYLQQRAIASRSGGRRTGREFSLGSFVRTLAGTLKL